MKSSKRYGSKVQLYHMKNGDISYYITYKIKQKKFYKKVGRKSEGINESKAIQIRNKILSEIRTGADFTNKSKGSAITFGLLAGEYFEIGAIHNKSNHKLNLEYNRHLKEYLHDKPVYLLSDKDIAKIQTDKKDNGLSNGSINQIIKLVKRIIGFGIKQGYIEYSPFRNIKMLKLDNTRLRFLTLDEIDKLYELTKDTKHLYIFCKMALATGARANTILNIKYKDIDFESRIINLNDFKRSVTYKSFINSEIVDLIKDESKEPNDYLVSNNNKAVPYVTLQKQLKPILDHFNSNLDKRDRKNRVVIHTLRHTFASHLAINGTPIHTIQNLMNHRDINSTLRYAKLAPDSGREFVKKLYKDKY